MANLLSLQFDIHVLIVRNLNLRDCLSYAELAPVCHDVVYYVFAHRIELDFSSLLIDNHHLTPIPDELFLRILYSHTRATRLRNFCISNSFAAFSALSNYLNLYWNFTFISEYDPSLSSTDSICGRYVGHPQGQLQSIYYLGDFGAHNEQGSHILEDILTHFDDEHGLNITNENNYSFPLLPDRFNWSTVDIDAPYSRCSVCDALIPFPHIYTQICSQCAYISDFLDSICNP